MPKRSNPKELPLYRQIADQLREAIERGEYSPGQRIPGENDLIKTHNISRNTARDALAVLRGEGLIETRRGAGNFMRRTKLITRNANERLSRRTWGEGRSIWSSDMQGRPSGQRTEVTEIDAPERIAGSLGIPPGTKVCRRRRIHHAEGRPVQMSTSYLSASLVAGTPITEPDSGAGGVYARLLDLGCPPARFREEVRARMPRREEIESLSLAAETPVIYIARTAFDADGAPLEVNEMVLDANTYLLQYDIDA